MTRPGERAAFGIVASGRRSQGRFDALGRYRALRSVDPPVTFVALGSAAAEALSLGVVYGLE